MDYTAKHKSTFVTILGKDFLEKNKKRNSRV